MKFSGAVFLLLGATTASLLSSEREYVLVYQAETFSGAYCHCLQHGAILAGFRDEMDLERASSLCPNCSVWIGLYHQGLSWLWISGDSYKFERWSPGARSSYPCVVMKNGLWSPENCLQRNPFLCYKETSSPKSKDSVTASWMTVTSRPFSTLAEMNGDGKSEKPSSAHTPSSPPEAQEDAQVTSTGFQSRQPTSSMQQTLPMTGGESEQPSSAHAPSSLPQTQEDAQVTSTGFESSQPTSSMQQVPPTTVVPLWDESPVIIQENRTWFEAAAACRTRGQLLAGRVALREGLKAWMGLHRHGLWGYWVWADGSAVEEPLNWGPGEPNDPIGGNCGAGTGTGEGVIWEDECCGVKLYYVCK